MQDRIDKIAKNIIASKNLNLYRVSYGKSDIPLEDRDYKIQSGSPAGNVKDYIEMFGGSYTKMTFWDKSGKEIEQIWESIGGKWKIK